MTWTLDLDGKTMHVGDDAYDFTRVSKCHLVQLAGTGMLANVFTLNTNSLVADCPTVEQPLAEKQLLLIGTWTSSTNVLGFRDDRRVYIAQDENENTSHFAFAPDGRAYQFTKPDGTETDHGTMDILGTDLKFSSKGFCETLTRQ